jgi:hypothetical protein
MLDLPGSEYGLLLGIFDKILVVPRSLDHYVDVAIDGGG